MGGQGNEKQVWVPLSRAQEGYQKARRRLGNKAVLSLYNLVELCLQKQSQETNTGENTRVDLAHAAGRNAKTLFQGRCLEGL